MAIVCLQSKKSISIAEWDDLGIFFAKFSVILGVSE